MSSRQAACFCLFLALFELLTYVASDVVMPAMLQVVTDLHADNRHVPTALNAYLLGGVAFQWLIGPLSDRFGRRPLLLIGVAGFALAVLATPMVGDIQLFNILRFAQGIGLGFVVVVSYPTLQEAFAETDAVRLMALLANIALLSPLLGPLLGSLLLQVMSWRELFIGIALLTLLVATGLWRFMPETIGVRRTDGSLLPATPLHVGQILASYGELLRNNRFMQGSLALGLISIPLIGWIGIAPLLLVQHQGLSVLAYGLWQLPIFGGLIAGNLALNHLAQRYELDKLVRMSLLPIIGGLAGMLTFTAATGWLAMLVIGMSVYAFGMGICNASLYRLTLFASESGKGTVAAMLGMLSVATIGLGSTLLAKLGAGDNLLTFATAATLTASCALWPLWRLLKPMPVTAPAG
ncbi:MFS transporter [Chitinivorax sp. B]|uniref:MFS transporter n=1 Tax=Chitinivorax sp. B TaxID=2502235 RepID=UPI002017767B|nr:MFS transporter [Chitinivorax sp. B]